MNRFTRMAVLSSPVALVFLASQFSNMPLLAQSANFHNAPASVKFTKNPYQGQQPDAAKSVYHSRCAACHGPTGEGSGNIPSLVSGKAQGASDGELFWYITKGDVNNGMPAWEALPEKDRWQVINFLRVLGGSKPGSPRVRLSADEAVEQAQRCFYDKRLTAYATTFSTPDYESVKRMEVEEFKNSILGCIDQLSDQGGRKAGSGKKEQGRKSSGNKKSGT